MMRRQPISNRSLSSKALPVVFMFSGQGSQYYHMGGELFKRNDLFQREMRRLDALAIDFLGESMIDRVYDVNRRKGDAFDRLLYSHPALFMQQYALSQVLSDLGVRPDVVLGSSLGEFVAAAVARVISVQDALSAVIQQARDLEEHCPPGGMLAVLHDPQLYEATPLIRENSELAGINFDSHFTVSGTREGLHRISDFLNERGINHLLLPLTRGVHSSLIDPAGPPYTAFLRQISFNPPEIPFVSSCRADLMKAIPPDYFWEVARRPIRFQETIRKLESKGDHIYLDLGPSGTLANFVAYLLDNDSDSVYMPILTPFGKDEARFEKAMNHFLKPLAPMSAYKTYEVFETS